MDKGGYPGCRRLRSDAELTNKIYVSMEQGHEPNRNGICLSEKIQVHEELSRDPGLMGGCMWSQLTEALKLKTRKCVSDGVALSPY